MPAGPQAHGITGSSFTTVQLATAEVCPLQGGFHCTPASHTASTLPSSTKRRPVLSVLTKPAPLGGKSLVPPEAPLARSLTHRPFTGTNGCGTQNTTPNSSNPQSSVVTKNPP